MNFFEVFLACLLANIAITIAAYFGFSLYWDYLAHKRDRERYEDQNNA